MQVLQTATTSKTVSFDVLPTEASRKALATNPSPSPSSTTLDVLPTAPSWKAFETSLYTSSTALKVLQSTVLTSTALDVPPSLTPWKTVDSNRASNSVKRRSNYPVSLTEQEIPIQAHRIIIQYRRVNDICHNRELKVYY